MPGDVVDAATRSRMMAGIRGQNTKPELAVRRGLHALGFRFRLHDRTLPGRPDLVLPRWRAVIQVQGCFWHGHDCPLFRWPGTRQDFWRTKIGRNMERDRETDAALDHAGWRVLKVWECALKGPGRIGADAVIAGVAEWLHSKARTGVIRGADRGGG
ncbi:very short patch repair endonuclease [Novosphingobium piscinae]|uniref:DNA mismatch endonuclease Vsr n=1 Tax=Novosphingobium piscinae TaxID=1507448 RepID=A0A7X1KQG1_9SPHN|nr:very short patch repair endonuclease [Novosphingobium piscinae]MBC2669704.1 DNA mismatch endonuclease Vsr [Novosphingobium piscinae]